MVDGNKSLEDFQNNNFILKKQQGQPEAEDRPPPAWSLPHTKKSANNNTKTKKK